MYEALASYSDRYFEPLRAVLKKERMIEREYLTKAFFFHWAFERAGAAQAYRIVAIKVLD
jgi:hypothetical protein